MLLPPLGHLGEKCPWVFPDTFLLVSRTHPSNELFVDQNSIDPLLINLASVPDESEDDDNLNAPVLSDFVPI